MGLRPRRCLIGIQYLLSKLLCRHLFHSLYSSFTHFLTFSLYSPVSFCSIDSSSQSCCTLPVILFTTQPPPAPPAPPPQSQRLLRSREELVVGVSQLTSTSLPWHPPSQSLKTRHKQTSREGVLHHHTMHNSSYHLTIFLGVSAVAFMNVLVTKWLIDSGTSQTPAALLFPRCIPLLATCCCCCCALLSFDGNFKVVLQQQGSVVSGVLTGDCGRPKAGGEVKRVFLHPHKFQNVFLKQYIVSKMNTANTPHRKTNYINIKINLKHKNEQSIKIYLIRCHGNQSPAMYRKSFTTQVASYLLLPTQTNIAQTHQATLSRCKHQHL